MSRLSELLTTLSLLWHVCSSRVRLQQVNNHFSDWATFCCRACLDLAPHVERNGPKWVNGHDGLSSLCHRDSLGRHYARAYRGASSATLAGC